MNTDIRASAQRRGVTRLCHFTPVRNLVHILTDPRGVLATSGLQEDERAAFNPTDLARMDGHVDHVCCSVEYPNAWYFRTARGKDVLFPDWVVLLLSPSLLWTTQAKFSSRNAAAGYGRYINDGVVGFELMFQERVDGSGGKVFVRGSSHPSWAPTDDQAEVLVPDGIGRPDILGIAVRSADQAARELARMEQLGAEPVPIWVAPDLYDPSRMSSQVRSGRRPSEQNFVHEGVK